jgi:glucose/mannose transport system permease protein
MNKLAKRERIVIFLTVVPTILVIAVFVYGFITWTSIVSFSNWNGLLPDYSFSGIKNYIDVVKNVRFKTDIFNNVFFSALFIGISIGGGLLLAILVEESAKGRDFFRNVFLFPMVISPVVTAVVWKWIFSPKTGINALLNTLLSKVGLEPTITFRWIISTFKIGPFNVALIPLIIASCWSFTGYIMAMYLAAIRGIPIELLESARVDGATDFTIYRKIILPLLKPITLSASIILAHISLRMFDLFYVMSGRGPGFITDFPSIFMYEATFRANRYGQGAAISLIMLLMVAVVIVPYLTIRLRKGVEN